ncbi:uncharacterized protein [Lolium perenne]|uniref:uncharacterized protein n=1 Tax=Lolium perenne TaxID=4522 RepID=UPI003A99A6CE
MIEGVQLHVLATMDLCRRLLCIMRGYNPGGHLSLTNSSTSSSTPAATTQHGQRWPSSPPLRFVGGLDMASVAGFISQLDAVIGFDTELSRTMTYSPTRRILWRTR